MKELSIRAGGAVTGLSHTGYRRWRNGDLRLSPERERHALAALAEERRRQQTARYGRTYSFGVDIGVPNVPVEVDALPQPQLKDRLAADPSHRGCVHRFGLEPVERGEPLGRRCRANGGGNRDGSGRKD